MHCKQWIFDMDGTLTDSMVVVWEGAPEALLARFGRTPKADLHETLLTMGMEDGAQYLIREYALPLDRNGYLDVMREVIAALYEKVELKPGVRDTLARLRAEGARNRPSAMPYLNWRKSWEWRYLPGKGAMSRLRRMVGAFCPTWKTRWPR